LLQSYKLVTTGKNMAAGDRTKKDLFQTPNPTELKAEAQKDPIPERENVPEADVAGNNPDDGDMHNADRELGRETAAEMSHSQVTTANLSGH
jgi:hypothetical protein